MHLRQFLLSILGKLPIGYYNGKLYKISSVKGQKTSFTLAEDKFKPWILIASRELYKEELDKLPLTNQSEVKRLLTLNNPNKDFQYRINNVTENMTFYNSWGFSKILPDAPILLPESVILANASENDIFELKGPLEKTILYIAKTEQGIFSSVPTKMLNSTARFAQSCGLNAQETSHFLSFEQLPALLLKGLSCLKIKDWLTFTKKSAQNFSLDNIKRPLLLVVVCFTGYFTVTSGYLYWQKWQVEQQLQDEQADVSSALALQDDLNYIKNRVQVLSPVVANFKSNTIIWTILLPLYEQANFANIRYEAGRFILRGTTDKATELLYEIASYEGVFDAKFDLPVSINRQRETFTISFQWQQSLKESGNVVSP